MTKFEVTDAMVEAAQSGIRKADWPWHTPSAPMRAAITAAIEASGVLEENARLRKIVQDFMDCVVFDQHLETDTFLASQFRAVYRKLNKEPTP
jgi:hypothetical protein